MGKELANNESFQVALKELIDCRLDGRITHLLNPDLPFSSEVRMYAALKTAVMLPVVSKRLKSSVKKGVRSLMKDLSVGVGSGSRAQLLSCSAWTAATTLSMVTGLKQMKWTSDDD